MAATGARGRGSQGERGPGGEGAGFECLMGRREETAISKKLRPPLDCVIVPLGL